MVWVLGRLRLLVCPAFPLLRVPGRAGFGDGRGQPVAGGPVLNTASQSAVHGSAQGQWAGRCSTRRRCGRVSRAGTVIRSRRRVAPRATAWAGLARLPAARSRLWVIAAQIVHALFAANRPSVISSPLQGAHHVRDEGCVVSEARRGCDYLPLSIRQRKVL